MAKRPCLDCPTLVSSGSRCVPCKRKRERKRGSAHVRGYPRAHRDLRESWAPEVATGRVRCRRADSGQCLEQDPLIAAGSPWQLGHPDVFCPAPIAPEHRRCNEATAGRQAPEFGLQGGGGDPL